jgi:hypothetical protein
MGHPSGSAPISGPSPGALPSDPRQLRPGVEVAISDIENQETSAAEKTAAFDMLMSVRGALTCTKVKQELQHAGKQQLVS